MKKIILIISLFLVLPYDSEAKPFNESNWYATVDVVQFKNKVMPMLVQFSSGKNNFTFKDTFPDEFKRITLYGHSEFKNDVSAVITGDFNAFSVTNYIIEKLHTVDGDSTISLNEVTKYNGINISSYSDLKKNEEKSFYSAKLNSNLVVASFDQEEVRNWIDHKYDINKIQVSGLISLLLNTESDIAHIGADLKSNSSPFNSTLFQKINQISANVYESSSEDLTVEAALSTADEAMTKQLEQVVNGLIAMNALSNSGKNNQTLAKVLSGLQINNDGNELLISVEVPYNLFSKAELD